MPRLRAGIRPLAAAPRAAALALALALGTLAPVAGCGPLREPATPADAGARAQALIESGNVAFEAGEFRLAAKRYAAAAALSPEDPAAHYGLGMALTRLGRDEEAREAYARARDLARRGGP